MNQDMKFRKELIDEMGQDILTLANKLGLTPIEFVIAIDAVRMWLIEEYKIEVTRGEELPMN